MVESGNDGRKVVVWMALGVQIRVNVGVILVTRGPQLRGCGSGYKWFTIAYRVTDSVLYSRGRTQAQMRGMMKPERTGRGLQNFGPR